MSKDIFAGPKTVYVYSKLANAQQYPVYERDPQGNAHSLGHVHINGGAGIANKHLISPLGVMTPITEEALAHLETCHVFNVHRDNGFISVRRDQVDIERAVAELTSERDNSAPIVPEDYQADVERAEEDPDAAVALPEGVKARAKRK